MLAPKGVQLQWVAELAERFSEEFVRVGPEGLPIDAGINPWRAFPQIVSGIDGVKPIRARAGWSPEQVLEYNRQRMESIVAAGWDLLVIDEAHHVAGSSEEVARHRLARELTASVPNVLLLSGTPHSGKSDGFRRFVGLLDGRYLEGAPLTRESVSQLVERTDKRHAVDNGGRPLFTSRATTIEVVPYGRRQIERQLYDDVTAYVREGYGRSVKERRPAVGFLLLLMQRLVSSSTAAILAALEKRATILDEVPEEVQLSIADQEWQGLTGEEQLSRIAEMRGHGWATERAEVEALRDLARRAASDGLDAKVAHFLDLLRALEAAEGDPDVKVLVFTEFLPTQEMLLQSLTSAGISTVAINGGMGLGERALAQHGFERHARVLVSTDAGGEGINLQFAHVLVNWDLPWAPTKIEQRIGRVDRIGQHYPVRAINLVRESSIDLRVLDVLERKLEQILSELGADKRGDVLEGVSARADRIYIEAIMNEDVDRSAADVATAARKDVLEQQEALSLITTAGVGSAAQDQSAVKSAIDAAAAARRRMVPDFARPVEAIDGLPEAVLGEPVPALRGFPSEGWWCCFEVADGHGRRTCFSIFAPDDAALVRPDLAERAWKRLTNLEEFDDVPGPSRQEWSRLLALGEDHGYRCWERLGSNVIATPVCRPLLVARATR